MPCEHTHGSGTSGTMVAGMTSVRAVEQTRMGIAALLVSNIGWGRAAAVLARAVRHECHQRAGVSADRHAGGHDCAADGVPPLSRISSRDRRALTRTAEQKAVRAGTRRHHGYQRELVAVHISGGQRPGAADLNRVPDYASAQRGAGRGHVHCAVTDVPVDGNRARRQFLRLRSAQTLRAVGRHCTGRERQGHAAMGTTEQHAVDFQHTRFRSI